MYPPAGTVGRRIIGKAYVAWVTIMAGPDRGKHNDMMQSNTQCRDNGLNRDDSDRQHDNDMGIKKRIAPTLLHSHQLLVKHSKHCHLTVKNEIGDTRDEIFAMINITIADRPHIPTTLKAEVDTGAPGNIMPLRLFRRMYPTKVERWRFPAQITRVPGSAVLTAYTGAKMPQYDSMSIHCSYRDKRCDAEFYVSRSTGPAIRGLPSCRELRLVDMSCAVKETLNRPNPEARIASTSDLIDADPDRFEGIDSFRCEFHITIEKSVSPVIQSPRRCHIHLKDEVKTQLNIMEEPGLRAKVSAATDWVSSIVYRRKSNNKPAFALIPRICTER